MHLCHDNDIEMILLSWIELSKSSFWIAVKQHSYFSKLQSIQGCYSAKMSESNASLLVVSCRQSSSSSSIVKAEWVVENKICARDRCMCRDTTDHFFASIFISLNKILRANQNRKQENESVSQSVTQARKEEEGPELSSLGVVFYLKKFAKLMRKTNNGIIHGKNSRKQEQRHSKLQYSQTQKRDKIYS